MVHTATTVYPPDMATMTDDQRERLRFVVQRASATEAQHANALAARDAVVRELHAEGVSDRAMAPDLGVHPTQVGNIRTGRRSSAKRRKAEDGPVVVHNPALGATGGQLTLTLDDPGNGTTGSTTAEG